MTVARCSGNFASLMQRVMLLLTEISETAADFSKSFYSPPKRIVPRAGAKAGHAMTHSKTRILPRNLRNPGVSFVVLKP